MQILFKKGNLGQHDLQIQDDYGSTPLHFASVRNRVDSVAFLLASGSNPSILNNDSKKPADVTLDEDIKKNCIV